MNLAFMVPLQHIGPALATSLAAMFNVGWLAAVLLRRGELQLDAQVRRRSARMAAAAVVMGVVLWLAQRELFAGELHGMARIGALAALVAVGMVSYGTVAVLSGAIDWRGRGFGFLPARWRARS